MACDEARAPSFIFRDSLSENRLRGKKKREKEQVTATSKRLADKKGEKRGGQEVRAKV